MDKRERRERRDNIIIYTTAIVFLLIVSIMLGRLIARTMAVNKWNETYAPASTSYTSKEVIIDATKKAINQKQYLFASVEQEEVGESEEDNISAIYTYRTNKDKDVVAYTYMNNEDTENNLLIEYWAPNNNGKFDVWIWASEVQSYVQAELDVAPVTMLTWDIMDNLDDYTLLSDYGKWGEQQEDCYVLALFGKSDVYDVIGEYVYISRRYLLPMGIITVGSNNEDEVVEYSLDSIPDNEDTESSQKTSIIRVSYSWTNEKLNEVNKPHTVMTEEEYINEVQFEE